VARRRWRWLEDCDDWTAFAAWRDARPWAARVEFVAGLEVLLDHGPEHDSYKVGEDLYVVYACSKGKILWLLVGVAAPGERRLLPLAWGTGSPSKITISRTAIEAAEKLRKWRGTV
jgi:hypothetical protein